MNHQTHTPHNLPLFIAHGGSRASVGYVEPIMSFRKGLDQPFRRHARHDEPYLASTVCCLLAKRRVATRALVNADKSLRGCNGDERNVALECLFEESLWFRLEA